MWDYKSYFAIFPECFNVPLIGVSLDQSNQTEVNRFLASYTEYFKKESKMAVRDNIEYYNRLYADDVRRYYL